jgi:hypothetical protein
VPGGASRVPIVDGDRRKVIQLANEGTWVIESQGGPVPVGAPSYRWPIDLCSDGRCGGKCSVERVGCCYQHWAGFYSTSQRGCWAHFAKLSTMWVLPELDGVRKEAGGICVDLTAFWLVRRPQVERRTNERTTKASL